MAEEKRINSRIANKHETEAVWEAHPDFIPMQGELIVYDADENVKHERVKMGDGTTPVNDLPFIGNELQISETKPSFACTWFKVTS